MAYIFPDKIGMTAEEIKSLKILMSLVSVIMIINLFLLKHHFQKALYIFILGVDILITIKHVFGENYNTLAYVNAFFGMFIPLTISLVFLTKKAMRRFIVFSVSCQCTILLFSEVPLTDLYAQIGMSLFIHLIIYNLSSGKHTLEELEKERLNREIKFKSDFVRQQIEVTEKTNKAKSQFLANISHEIKTPLHAVLSFAELGMERNETLSTSERYQYFKEIYTTGNQLHLLMNSLLDYSKLDDDKVVYDFKRENILLIIKTVINQYSKLAEKKKLSLNVNAIEDDYYCKVDQGRIKQVLGNLLSNAIKYSFKETTITFNVSKLDKLKTKISISNKGQSIPKDEIEYIFEKFTQSSQTSNDSGGTGLGLAISKQIIIDHGGEIWAEVNRDDVTFSFTLDCSKTM